MSDVLLRPLGPKDSLQALTSLLHAAYACLAARGLNFTAVDQSVETTRERLVETLEVWLECQGEVRPTAERLHVHTQTVRYRVAQLRELLGDRLQTPDGRLELELAVRARRLLR